MMLRTGEECYARENIDVCGREKENRVSLLWHGEHWHRICQRCITMIFSNSLLLELPEMLPEYWMALLHVIIIVGVRFEKSNSE